MQFPDSKLSLGDAVRIAQKSSPIESPRLRIDPDLPHPYVQARGAFSGCDVCGGSSRTPIHDKPVDGWPQ